jgi:hypothetical protein
MTDGCAERRLGGRACGEFRPEFEDVARQLFAEFDDLY